MTWAAIVVGGAGLAVGWYGSEQKKKAGQRAQGGYVGALDTRNRREFGENQALTGQLDQLAMKRRAALTHGLGDMASGARFDAGANAAGQGIIHGGAAAQAAQQGIPFDSNYTTMGSGATASALRAQGMGTNARLGNALAYTGAIRGNQAVENYDQDVLNRLGTDYTRLGRKTGEAQQLASLRQAELDRIWSQISAEHGREVANSQNAGNNAQMLGQALMLGGTYASSATANKPAAQNTSQGWREYNQADPTFSAYQGPH